MSDVNVVECRRDRGHDKFDPQGQLGVDAIINTVADRCRCPGSVGEYFTDTAR